MKSFKAFLPARFAIRPRATSAIMALSQDSRAGVDSFCAAALAQSGTEPKAATDLGLMYNRTVCDPDAIPLCHFGWTRPPSPAEAVSPQGVLGGEAPVPKAAARIKWYPPKTEGLE